MIGAALDVVDITDNHHTFFPDFVVCNIDAVCAAAALHKFCHRIVALQHAGGIIAGIINSDCVIPFYHAVPHICMCIPAPEKILHNLIVCLPGRIQLVYRRSDPLYLPCAFRCRPDIIPHNACSC